MTQRTNAKRRAPVGVFSPELRLHLILLDSLWLARNRMGLPGRLPGRSIYPVGNCSLGDTPYMIDREEGDSHV